MADSSRVQISYLEQTAKGTVQSAPFKELRHTGGSFGAPTETQRSEEITGDAQRGEAVRVGLNPEGTINFELSAQTFDDLLKGLMRSTWSTAADAPEQLADDFALDNYTKGTGWTHNITDGEYDCDGTQTGDSMLHQDMSTDSTSEYIVEFTVTGITAGNIAGLAGGTAGTNVDADGTYAQKITAGATAEDGVIADLDFVGTVTEIKVRPAVEANASESAFTIDHGDLTARNIVVGQWVYVGGFADDDVNGWYKATAITTTKLTVSPAPTADTNTEGNMITITGSYIRNGATSPYYAFQLQHLDLTDRYRLIDDARVGQMELRADARGRVTGAFNFMGRNHELKSAKSGDGNVTDAPTTDVLNTVDHVDEIFINGDAYTGCVMSFGLNADMNPRRINCVGELQSNDIGLGSLAASGNLSIYLTDTSWADLLVKYLAFTKLSVAFAFEDGNGNGYVFEMPRVALTNEPGNIPGPDNDVMLEFDFEAEPGTIGTETKTIQISRRQAE